MNQDKPVVEVTLADITFKIEFAILWPDHTWTTEVFNIPYYLGEPEVSDSEIEYWWLQEYGELDKYEGIAGVKVYSICPGEEVELYP